MRLRQLSVRKKALGLCEYPLCDEHATDRNYFADREYCERHMDQVASNQDWLVWFSIRMKNFGGKMRKTLLAISLLFLCSSTAQAQHSITLNWTQGLVPNGASCPAGSPTGETPVVTQNTVYRGTTAGGESTTPFAIVKPPATTYVDTAVTPGTTYYYTVTASNCAGESPKSNEVSAVIPNPIPPNPPQNLQVTVQ